MRCSIECWIPAGTGNCSIPDGTLPVKIKKYLETAKPEAMYFTVKDGQRTMFAIVNIPSGDKMVAMLEPLWLDGDASVSYARDVACRSREDGQGQGKTRPGTKLTGGT